MTIEAIFLQFCLFFFVAKNSEAKVDSDDSDDGKLKTQSLFVEYSFKTFNPLLSQCSV